MLIGNPPALPDTGAGAPPQTSPKPDSAPADLDWYAAYLRMNGQNAGRAYIQPQNNNRLWQDTGTITNDRTSQIREPAYYDPKTSIGYRYPGLFLSGLTLGLDKVDTRKLSPWGKATYYAGRAAGALGLGYGLGVIGGSLLGASSRATTIAGRIAEFGARHPVMASAARGTMKGLLVGGEVAKGIKMKSEGYGWSDVVGTIGSDFAGLYAFERGMNSAFVSTRRNAVRKQFAEKNSRFFAGETYKGSYIIKDDPSQVRLTRTLRNNEMVLEFKPKRPHPPKSIPKHDIAKLPQEVPTNDAFITGTINTKSKPFTTFKVEKPKTSDYIKPSEDTKLIDLSDELKFLESEKDLPPQLYTEKEIVTKVFDSGKVSGSTVSTGSGTEQVLKTDAITITKLNIERTRLNEATRISGLKSNYMRMMKDTMPKIKGLGDSISRAARDAFGGVMGALSGANPVSSASASSHTTSASSTFFNTGAGFSGMEPKQGSGRSTKASSGTDTSGQLDFSTGTEYYYWTGVGDIYSEYPMTRTNTSSDTKGTEYYYWTGVGDIYSEYPMTRTNTSSDTKTDQTPKGDQTGDQANDIIDKFTFPPLAPPFEVQKPQQNVAQKQKYKLAYVQRLQMPKLAKTKLVTIAPIGLFLPRAKPPRSFRVVDKRKRWSKKNLWGELSLSLDSLRKSLKSMKFEAMEGFAAMPEKTKRKRKPKPKRSRRR